MDDAATEVHLAVDNPETRQAIQDALLAVYRDALDSGGYDSLDRLNSDSAYDAMQDTDFDQFRSLAQDLSGRVAARLAEDVRREVADGVAQGESSSQLATRIQDAFDATKVDALRIARTEAMRAYNRGTLDAAGQAGADKWVFRAHPDADLGQKEQPCQDLNGQVFDVDDDSAMPPDSTHPNCTCWAEPYIEGTV
jgi:phage putative head morphogenesis protein, SPP1 gp7 family